MSMARTATDTEQEPVESPAEPKSAIFQHPLLKPLAGILGLVVGLAILKPFLSEFSLILATQMFFFCLVAISLQLLWGRAGLGSFGQATFFGLGAYTYAVVSTRFGDPDYSGWIPVLLSVTIPLLVAAVLGYFLFFGGVRGAYFTIVTLASVLIANQVVISWRDVTGGDTGLTNVPGLVLPFGLFSLDFTSREGKYYLGIIAVCPWASRGRRGWNKQVWSDPRSDTGRRKPSKVSGLQHVMVPSWGTGVVWLAGWSCRRSIRRCD